MLYVAVAVAGGALSVVTLRWSALYKWRATTVLVLVLLAVGMLVFALRGVRALRFASTVLDPVLEGRDLTVIGAVVGLPDASDTGVRFRFRVVSASQPARQAFEVAVDYQTRLVPRGWCEKSGVDRSSDQTSCG